MAKSRHQAQNEQKIIGLENKISDEKVKQFEYKYKSEIERTKQEDYRYQQATCDTHIEQHRLTGKKADVEAARYDAETRKVGAKQAETRLGMASDQLKALNTERQIKQKMLAENLNALHLQASQLRETNQLKMDELKILGANVPSLKLKSGG